MPPTTERKNKNNNNAKGRSRSQSRKDAASSVVVSRRAIRALLRRDGRKDEITQKGFNLLSRIGLETMRRLVMSAKQEMVHSLGTQGMNVTINNGIISHAANCIKIPGSITDEAVKILISKNYNPRAMRRSATKRLVANHGGKKRSRSDVPPFLYCIAMVVIDEIVSQIQEKRGSKNIRIKNEHIYSVIKDDKSNLLGAPHLKDMIGHGMSFV